MEIFIFDTDREDSGPFVSGSLHIICPTGDVLGLRRHHCERHKNQYLTCQKMSEGHTKVKFRVECASTYSQGFRSVTVRDDSL